MVCGTPNRRQNEILFNLAFLRVSVSLADKLVGPYRRALPTPQETIVKVAHMAPAAQSTASDHDLGEVS